MSVFGLVRIDCSSRSLLKNLPGFLQTPDHSVPFSLCWPKKGKHIACSVRKIIRQKACFKHCWWFPLLVRNTAPTVTETDLMGKSPEALHHPSFDLDLSPFPNCLKPRESIKQRVPTGVISMISELICLDFISSTYSSPMDFIFQWSERIPRAPRSCATVRAWVTTGTAGIVTTSFPTGLRT